MTTNTLYKVTYLDLEPWLCDDSDDEDGYGDICYFHTTKTAYLTIDASDDFVKQITPGTVIVVNNKKCSFKRNANCWDDHYIRGLFKGCDMTGRIHQSYLISIKKVSGVEIKKEE